VSGRQGREERTTLQIAYSRLRHWPLEKIGYYYYYYYLDLGRIRFVET